MFIMPPNNFNQTTMWNPVPMFAPPPMMPLPNFDNFDEMRQKPMTPPPVENEGFQIAPNTPVQNNPLYNQGWLQQHIGQYVKIEFILGTNMLIDREGILREVGISYVVINEAGTNDLLMCDMYSIKFVRIFTNPPICITK